MANIYSKRAYFIKRLLFIPFTLLGIMALNFLFVQLAPGGPVEQLLLKAQNPAGISQTLSLGGGGADVQMPSDSIYQGHIGLQDNLRKELEQQFGFDKPPLTRFFYMMKNYICFDFGNSFYQDKSVIDLILEKMPVSISLGVFSTLLIYIIAIPFGIKKAVAKGGRFDAYSSFILTILYAMPSFLLGIFLLMFLAGGDYLSLFPLSGLTSDNFHQLSFFGKMMDYLWHITLPVITMTVGGLVGLTFLTKNAFLDELGKQYVITARAKGLSQSKILYGHIFQNAMLVVIAGFPSMLMSMLFTGSVLIEVIFSLDGLGLLGFEAIENRDYPVIFGTLYLFALMGLILNILSDFIYTLVDPRIHFAKRRA